MKKDIAYGLFCMDTSIYSEWNGLIRVYSDKKMAEKDANKYNRRNAEYLDISKTKDKSDLGRYEKKLQDFLDSIPAQELGENICYYVKEVDFVKGLASV